MNNDWRTESTKHKLLLSLLLLGLFLLNPTLLFLSFRLLWMSSGKACESLKASFLHKHTIFPLSQPNEQTWGLWGQHLHEKQCWLVAILPAYDGASSLSAMEVKHFESLGNGPTEDANEDREVPLTMQAHTHIKQHLSVNKRGSSNRPWRRESWRTSKALMWSDGRGPRRDGILPSTSNWQEKERKQEEGSEIKKINIAELIAKRGMTRHNKVKRMMGERWSLSVLLCLAFTLKMIQHGEHMDVNYISLNGDTF